MDIIQESRQLAVSEIEKFGHPNLILFELSEKKTIELAGKLGADKAVTQIGFYLMDLKLGQALKENKLPQHIQMSIAAAENLLAQTDISEASREKIINCIEAHHGQVPFKCLEAEICANADCYRFIHPRGFFVFLTVLGKEGTGFSECLTSAESKMEEKHSMLSLDICRKELERYYQTLKQYIADARSL